MEDSTVPDDNDATNFIGNPVHVSYRRTAAERAAMDELVARVLINSWSLATGRTLPPGIPPQLLTEDELIDFWADDKVQ